MRNWHLFFISITVLFIGCGQSHPSQSTGANSGGLTCLVLGYDSIIYYTGTSKQMQDVHKGNITDTEFLNTMFKKIKNDGLSITLKPGDGANMLPNFQEIVNLTNSYSVQGRLVDSIDTDEENAFGFVTPPAVKEAMRGEERPLKLSLPKDEPDSS